ncbi:hypothetical protein HCN44_009841 [Aphidius gifuensis]|uniref:Uncharacterized protein n=1 Tax=Aphidius gifuensis TaxID=684658 RepID=A0A834Y022_APHGI|nr:alpha-ketoglutarate-dependent dioxygenase alkB homolog 4-like [Aphidius gifuensis]KAF7996056.1 hypothetical protein HCN44_009841 [Aphidius gifuensis]
MIKSNKMEQIRSCGCKGIRTCFYCEKEYKICKQNFYEKFKQLPSYVYCPECDKAWPGWDIDLLNNHPNHTGTPIFYPGVFIKLDFLSHQESKNLINNLDELSWETSQSGRRKQNYGPKCNFKKRKLRLGNFNGFPITTKFVQHKLNNESLLKNFCTIEQCSLEYTKERGSSIDPHIDDCWIWGERIVTVNVIGDSVLTMTKFSGPNTKYNLPDLDTYPPVVERQQPNADVIVGDVVIRLPMPARSLMILYGPSRYEWEHSVLREDIDLRRVCIAYREFTSLSSGKNSHETIEILEKSKNFW